MIKNFLQILSIFWILIWGLLTNPITVTAADKPFIFGLLRVGPYNDHGYR